MSKPVFTSLLIAMLFFFSQQIVVAQRPAVKPKPVTGAAAKVKHAPVKSFLSNYTGLKNICSAEVGKEIIKQPLLVKDDKEVVYKISSYQLGYRRIGITEDEATGKTSPQSDLIAQRFTETPLPAIWQTNITDQLHKGEELFFFDIIVFDKAGRRFFAPDLKITIE